MSTTQQILKDTRGQKDKAIASLQRALELGPWMKRQASRDEDFASIREDERFKALVAGG